jgi:hypothetical protein
MRFKKILVFVFSIGISFVAAGYRWGDSGHAIGLISERGGKARHPTYLEGGKERYTEIITATVLPPYRGDARVELEGSPPLNVEIHSAEPVVELGLRRKPRFRDNTLHGLEPGDRIALWLIMRPPSTEIKSGNDVAGEISGGKYTVAFYDTLSSQSLLRIPIIFKGKEAADETCH